MATSTAVVLCAGLKTDALTGFRSFRQLADTLAQAGFPTLRFQYPGTGDSCELDAAEYWAAWQASVHMAADWLRNHCGAQRIVLCGLRFGAMLAAVVAENRADVAGLVLLAPVVRGKSYIRQLMIEAKLQGEEAGAGDNLAVDGLLLPEETVRLIRQVDLRSVTLPPMCPVAVYAETPSPVLSQCAQAWARCGAKVTLEDFAGLEAMLRLNFMIHEAPAAVGRIAAWLRAAVEADRSGLQPDCVPADAEIRPAGCIETPLRFGVNGALFGILCRPSACAESDVAVVIGNTAGDPHCAPLHVDLARRFAAAGFASLRMDFAGVGDSLAPGDAETNVLETDRRPDMIAALDALSQIGFKHFALEGLCSAAYHAFHTAVVDPRIRALLLVNIPPFTWRDSNASELQVFAAQSPLELLRKMCSPQGWMVLYRGRLKLAGRLTGLGIWLVRKAEAVVQRIAHPLGFRPRPSFARASVGGLSQRVRSLFVFSKGDVGIAAFTQAFTPKQIPSDVTVQIIPVVDHNIAGREARRLVAEHVIGFLLQNQERTADSL